MNGDGCCVGFKSVDRCRKHLLNQQNQSSVDQNVQLSLIDKNLIRTPLRGSAVRLCQNPGERTAFPLSCNGFSSRKLVNLMGEVNWPHGI